MPVHREVRGRNSLYSGPHTAPSHGAFVVTDFPCPVTTQCTLRLTLCCIRRELFFFSSHVSCPVCHCLNRVCSCAAAVMARCVSAAIVIGGVFFYSYGSKGTDHRPHKPSTPAVGRPSTKVVSV